MGLRIYHNGMVKDGNPHWHLWFQQNGNVRGEVLCYQHMREVDDQLNEAETQVMFQIADKLSEQFQPSEHHLETDDICIKRTEQGKTLYWYKVPPDKQTDGSVTAFFNILKRLVEKYKPFG
jgi:hypothetical protein